MGQLKNLTIPIYALAFEGYGVGRVDDFVYFVKNAVPGDLVEAIVTKKRKSYSYAITKNVIESSPNRISPSCKFFGECGGCSLQNLKYEEQLYWKTQFVKDALKKFANLDPSLVKMAMGSKYPYEYRNKMEFSFSANRWLTKTEVESRKEIIDRNFALGLHTPENYQKVIDIDNCHIQNSYANKILNFVRYEAKQNLLDPYDNSNNSGLLKNLVIRHSVAEDRFLVILITNSLQNEFDEFAVKNLVSNIKQNFNKVKGAILAINPTRSPVARGQIIQVEGEIYLYEKILDVEYRISPFSFFQTNSFQLNNFIQKIIEIADFKENQVVWDLYCGAGSITLPSAKFVDKIYGFELIQESIEDAKFNAELNKISNAYFQQLDLHSRNIINELVQHPKPDVVLVDPPRAGLHQNLLETLLHISPKEIVYVSCNPATQARDLNLLKENYNIVESQPVDMFPQTYHIENIVKLIKK